MKLIKIKNNDFAEKELCETEKMEIRTNFKFGIVCCKKDENNEDNLFGVSKTRNNFI